MIQEWFKNGNVYTFEMTMPHFCDKHDRFRCDDTSHNINGLYYTREHALLEDGYVPVFDMRWVSNINGKSGSLILENDVAPPTTLTNFQETLKAGGFSRSEVHNAFTNIHPGHIDQMKQILGTGNAKNILIDSMFKNVEQFRFLVNKLFSYYTEVNFFIHSSGCLKTLLQDEIDNHMDKYPVRNAFYKNFNDLTFVLMKSYIYEVDYDASGAPEFATRIKYNNITNELSEGLKYKFMLGQYKTNDSDVNPKQSKSKWV